MTNKELRDALVGYPDNMKVLAPDKWGFAFETFGIDVMENPHKDKQSGDFLVIAVDFEDEIETGDQL